MLRARRLIVLLVLTYANAGVQAAADVSYIKVGTLVDVTRGRSLVNQVIVIQGDKIARVAAAADITIPPTANVIDLSGKTVPRETLYGVLNARKTLNADIIAVEGNPLETIELLEDVSFVMKGGEIFKHQALAQGRSGSLQRAT